MAGDGILVVNAGSSSIKVSVFDGDLTLRLSAAASEIGGASALKIGDGASAQMLPDHRAALSAILSGLAGAGIEVARLRAAAHRVVHGGTDLTGPCRVTPEVERQIEACIPLAPLHNPHNLSAIRALGELAPDLPQFATFDTGFHGTIPDVAARYAIPGAEASKGIRRYGFHGTSCAALLRALPEVSGMELPARLLVFHLGNGASITAIRDGHSVATTMGYSPVSGLTMGTRSGDIDANAVLRLAKDHGIDGAWHLLNYESGLLGLSGTTSDMAALEADASKAARFAVGHFAYWAARHAGSLVAALEGLDALAFTGGIGEHSARIRAEIMERLGWLGLRPDAAANAAHASRLHATGSPVTAWIVPADEEAQIARDALALLNAS